MTTEISKPYTFEDKLMERIRASIGELMTETDLKRLVEKGIEKALYDRPMVKEGGYNRDAVYGKSMIDKIAEEILVTETRQAVQTWMRENPEQLKETVTKVLQAGMVGALQSVLVQHFQGPLWALQNSLREKGINL